jgi:hypothetical protein
VNHVLRKEERVALEALEFEFELPNYSGKRRYYENQDLLIKYRNKKMGIVMFQLIIPRTRNLPTGAPNFEQID